MMPWISGDQHPLKWGIGRAITLYDRFPERKVLYFRHDADGQSDAKPLSKNTRRVIAEQPPFSLRQLSGTTQLFSLLKFEFPFGIPQFSPGDLNLGAVSINTLGTELKAYRDLLPSKLDVVSTESTHLKSVLTNRNAGRLVLTAFLGSTDFMGLVPWYRKVVSCVSQQPYFGWYQEACSRLDALESTVRRWIYNTEELSISQLFWMISELVLSRELESDLTGTSLDMLKNDGFGIFNAWKLANSAVETQLPFFAVKLGTDGLLHRLDFDRENEFEEAAIAVIPKAIPLYIHLRAKGYMVSGGIPYGESALGAVESMGVRLLPQMVMEFKPGQVIYQMGLVPDLKALWESFVTPDTAFRKSLLNACMQISYKYWLSDENLDMIAVWILGGDEAIYETLNTASYWMF